MSREENKLRRAVRRAQVAFERAKKQKARERAALLNSRRTFVARCRRGGTPLVKFTFSGVPVPVGNPNNPDGELLVQMTNDQAASDSKDN